MTTNRVSAALTETDKTAVLDALVQAKLKMPFLINLSTSERKRTRTMGAKSVEYVNLTLQGSQSFGALIPTSLDVTEFSKDVALVNQLLAIRVELEALLDGIDDTMMAAGAEAMQAADMVYSYLKTGAKSNAGIRSLTAEISKRYVKRSRVPEVLKA